MDKVYILETSGGEYDSSWTSIVGVFSSKEEAEKAELLIKTEREKLATEINPFGFDENNFYKNSTYNNLSKEDKILFYEWSVRKRISKEQWFFEIIEMELNQILKDTY